MSGKFIKLTGVYRDDIILNTERIISISTSNSSDCKSDVIYLQDKDCVTWYIKESPSEILSKIEEEKEKSINISLGRVSSDKKENICIPDKVSELIKLVHSHVGETNFYGDRFGIDNDEEAIIGTNTKGVIDVTLYDDYNE